MAYTLQALVAKSGGLSSASIEGAKVVPLRQGFEMLPFTNAFIKTHRISFLPLTDVGSGQLPESIRKLCTTLSKGKQLAYVEAEFFGGAGTQACIVFGNGEVEWGPVVSEIAINSAMAFLGAKKQSFHDEFEALGLNEHSDTEDWAK